MNLKRMCMDRKLKHAKTMIRSKTEKTIMLCKFLRTLNVNHESMFIVCLYE